MAKKKAKKASHTPGPWKFNGLDCIHAKNEYGDMDIVASIMSEEPDSVYARNEAEAMANAVLIEQAPQLLLDAQMLAMVMVGDNQALITERYQKLLATIRLVENA